jgi:hypothetical protein
MSIKKIFNSLDPDTQIMLRTLLGLFLFCIVGAAGVGLAGVIWRFFWNFM